MTTLWRWTSHLIFLVIARNICCILSQDVGQHCLPPLAPQGEPLRDCYPGIPQFQMNNLLSYPQNGIAPAAPIGLVPEYQRLPSQDCPYSVMPFNQQTNTVPNYQHPCTNPGSLNAQDLQGPQRAGPGFNGPVQLYPFSQPILQQVEYPTVSPCLTQQSTGFPPSDMLPQVPLLPFPGKLSSQCSNCQQIDDLPLPNGLGNQLNPLVPIANLGLPCSDVLYRQGMALSSPIFTPSFPGASIDVFPLGPQCYSGLNGPINPLVPPTRVQGPILPTSQINCLPQPTCDQQCDIIPDTKPCSSIAPCAPSVGPVYQNSLAISNMFKLPRPTIFPRIAPFQGPLSLCDTVSSCSNQVSPALNQQEPICSQSLSAPAPCIHDIPLTGWVNQNVQQFPAVSSPICQPSVPFNSGPCPLTNDIASINLLPTPLIPQPKCPITVGPHIPYTTDCPPIAPLVVTQSCNTDALPPVLSSPVIPRKSESLSRQSACQSATPDTVPTHINLLINVPAPNISPPSITIINATPAPIPAVSDDSSYVDPSYPMPPVIVEGRRSRSRSWLPLLLVALIASDDFGGCGGGGSSCCYDSSPIPIPYPIAIPTNNPVIVNK